MLYAIDDVFEADFEIQQGSDFAEVITFRWPDGSYVDLTGFTGVAKIRDVFGAGSTVLATFAVNFIDRANGQLELRLTAAQTAALTRPATASPQERETSFGFHDLVLSDGTYFYRYLQGKVTLSAEVSY